MNNKQIEFFKFKCRKGLKENIAKLSYSVDKAVYEKRLEDEMEVIIQMGFASYFLVVQDYNNWAKSQKIPVGPGRGCLSGTTMVHTPNGLINIKDLKSNMEVYDENGNICKINQTFEYDIDENLLEINCSYGGYPIQMTKDHKVLVSKVKKEKNEKKIQQGYKYEKGTTSPIWIAASEIEKGDLLVVPKIRFPIKRKRLRIKNNVYSYKKNSNGVKTLAKKIGVSSSALYSFRKGSTKNTSAQVKIKEFLENNRIDLNSIFQNDVTVAIPLNLELNFETGKLFGLWISDGWTRKNNDSTVGFCCKRSEDDGTIAKLIKRILKISPSTHDHKKKDLRQFIIHHKGLADFFRELFLNYKCSSSTKYIPKILFETNESFRQGLLEGLWAGDGSHKGKTKYSSTSKALSDNVFTLLRSLGYHAGIKHQERIEKRTGFRKNTSWMEYSVVSAPRFKNPKSQFGIKFDGKYTYYRVQSIKEVSGVSKVYDFEVPSTNSYLTDGFVVHNSAAGAITSWALGITSLIVDPIKYNLYFERFLNIGRAGPPKIETNEISFLSFKSNPSFDIDYATIEKWKKK